jgi:phosphohistidine phosphatase
MKTLLVLRHAKSSWDNPATTDHERILNKRGRKSAPRMGQLLVNEGLVPELVLCSTAHRARETADLLFQVPGFESRIVHLDELYLAPPQAYFSMLSTHVTDQEIVMVIGHNPGLEDFVDQLTGEPTSMPTAALARIAVDCWQELASDADCRLVDHWLPRELD